MSFVAVMLAAAGALCCAPIYSVGDLTSPIQYVDKGHGYFIGIDRNKYTIGTALDDIKNPANDMPQVSGRVENCSSRTFKCRSIAYLVFAIPNGRDHSVEYKNGPMILIKRLKNGGWRGSATCSMLTKTGCASRVVMDKLVVAYQYDVDPDGVLKSVKIQNWNNKKVVSTQTLVLVSEIGLKLR
jgi:hypothetical protein